MTVADPRRLEDLAIKVLVADGDYGLAGQLHSLLAQHSVSTLISTTSSDAIVRLLSGAFDAVVLGTNIPGDYREVNEAALLSSTCPSVVILVDPGHEVDSFAFVDTLDKPFMPDDLLALLLRIALDRERRSHEPEPAVHSVAFSAAPSVEAMAIEAEVSSLVGDWEADDLSGAEDLTEATLSLGIGDDGDEDEPTMQTSIPVADPFAGMPLDGLVGAAVEVNVSPKAAPAAAVGDEPLELADHDPIETAILPSVATPNVAHPSPPLVPGQLRPLPQPLGRSSFEEREVMPRLVPQPGLRTAMPFVGDLAETPMSALLYKLFANHQTGELNIHSRGNDRTLYFRDGEPVAATSRATGELVGAVAVDLGLLSLEELEDVLCTAAPGVALGEQLVAAGLVTPDQLTMLLDEQVFQRVLGCFTVKRGAFMFREGDDWASSTVAFRQNPIELIWEGISRHLGPGQLTDVTMPFMQHKVSRTPKFEGFAPYFPGLDDRSDVVAAIDGTRTLSEVAGAGHGEMLDGLRLVWALRQAAMVSLTLPTASPAPVRPVRKAAAAPPPSPSRPLRPRRRAPAPAPAKLDPAAAAQQLRAKINDYSRRLASGDPSVVLGLGDGSGAADARAAFRRCLDDLTPPRGAKLAQGLVSEAKGVLDRVKAVYDEVAGGKAKSPERVRRSRPPAAAPGSGSPRPGPAPLRPRGPEISKPHPTSQPASRASQPARPARAPASRRPIRPPEGSTVAHGAPDESAGSLVHVYLERARKAAADFHWKNAFRFTKRAAEIDGQNPEVVAMQAWIIFNLPASDRDKKVRVCKERLEVAITLDPSHIDAHLYLARILEKTDDRAAAFGQYRTVVELSSGHREAKRALNRLQDAAPVPSKESEDEGGSVLGRLHSWIKD